MKGLPIGCIATICLLLCGCFSESGDQNPPAQEIITDQSAGLNFSLHARNGRLFIIYPSLNALSLNLVTADLSADPSHPVIESTTYLDRISYSPDIDESFGRHLFLTHGRLQHILYTDRESEDSSVLKWLSKKEEEETWWIDALPGLSEPLLAVPVGDEEGMLNAVVAENGSLSLYRLSAEEQPALLAAAPLPSGDFRLLGDLSVLRYGDAWSFTAYDGGSKRLYFIQPGEDKIYIEAIYPAGEVHHSAIIDGRLLVLVFEPSKSTITLLERPMSPEARPQPRPFETTAVTLCEGTTSVFVGSYEGTRLFLFNERMTNRKEETIYQLSLLHEAPGDKCKKRALKKTDKNIDGFEALQEGDYLYVLYLQGGSLKLLALALAELCGDS